MEMAMQDPKGQVHGNVEALQREAETPYYIDDENTQPGFLLPGSMAPSSASDPTLKMSMPNTVSNSSSFNPLISTASNPYLADGGFSNSGFLSGISSSSSALSGMFASPMKASTPSFFGSPLDLISPNSRSSLFFDEGSRNGDFSNDGSHFLRPTRLTFDV